MKKFIAGNWYKLMVGLSMVMASFGFMVYSVSSATAKGSGMYSNIPVNSDGSITIKLTGEQLKVLTPDAIQSVDLKLIDGWEPAVYDAYKDNQGNAHYSMGVRETHN